MDGSHIPVMTRRVLYDAGGLRVGQVAARPVSPGCMDVEAPGANVLAFPLRGVFARHPSPRRELVATANHVVAFPADQPYRVSFPGGIGDDVLVLQWSSEALVTKLPRAEERFLAMAASNDLLEPGQMVRRSVLHRRLARGEGDPLEIEGLCAELLRSCLRIGEAQPPGPRRIESVKEAVALAPDRKWTLSDLAEIARMSPYHLAHVFRQEVGMPVYAYVLRLRLAQALSAVVDSDTDITTIALDAGFASHSHFTLHFRTLFGVTPAALRRGVGSRPAELRKIVTAR
ncbi:HTH-type transcriptional activator RhaS [Usitatibacter rugosus]|uniref:HTH-type transcriptional activator RhaS n=1 Tax=Usitatibacter rugosus TaxID=2732067 RepID=A0A6M4GNW0_9PROT|nr:AraC family transcriptional regulator [Usitatibacter rugosus]QJR09010.1 HTH-type transcriptional activator RhaS [Usitatibacter rugosus]